MEHLNEAYIGKTQTIRKKALTLFLNSHCLGELNENELKIFKNIFNNYYTPDLGETKYSIDEIYSIEIKQLHKYRQFRLIVNDINIPCGIKWLAGASRTSVNKVSQAGRLTIEPQIKDFRKNNKLNINDICPVKGIKLGYDAEVDHVIPFNKLLKNFISVSNITIDGLSKFVYFDKCSEKRLFKEPYKTLWYDYHKNNAELRYLSKEGNKIAHLI
tara:strand:- start:54 stop:698 length:645 start_codon:yes stop_codon:yes gene_type:complete